MLGLYRVVNKRPRTELTVHGFLFMLSNQIRPGGVGSNTILELDLTEFGELEITVYSKLDSTNSTSIKIGDITQQDLRDMALILNRLADSMAD